MPWVLLVVVVVVVVERRSGPVSGFGCTRTFFGVHWVVLVCISTVLALSCQTNDINVRSSTGRPGFLYCFGEFEFCGLTVVAVLVVVVVVVVVAVQRGSGPVSGFG